MGHRDERLTVNHVIDLVIDRLASGIYPLGSKLPTSRELALELGVHRNTIAKAYREIARMNLVSIRQGRGTYVVALPEANEQQSIGSQIDEALEAVTLKAFRLGIPEEELRRRLDEQASRIYQGVPLRLAFAECNDHDLNVAIAEIEMFTNIPLTPLPIDEINQNPESVAKRFDVVLTSLFHITEVTNALQGHLPRSNIISVYTQPDEFAVREIAQLTPGMRVGIVGSNPGGARRFIAQVHSYAAVETEALVAPSDTEIIDMASRVEVIICTRSAGEQVRSLHLPNRIIELSFHISRQSANRIVEALDAVQHDAERVNGLIPLAR